MRTLLCMIGWHSYGDAWDVRPETQANLLGLGTVICWHCGRLDAKTFIFPWLYRRAK